jgi:hypothetical protein
MYRTDTKSASQRAANVNLGRLFTMRANSSPDRLRFDVRSARHANPPRLNLPLLREA